MTLSTETPVTDDNQIELDLDDRRAVIEAAFDAEDSPEKPTESGPKTPDLGDGTPPAPAKSEPAKDLSPEGVEKTPEAPGADKPPQSWRPAEKAKWATLDPEVRQEVLRREKEITKTLDQTAQARHIAQNFQEAIQPFQSRLQALKADPIVAVRELLHADYILSSAPKLQRAERMAKLIADYDIDIATLDQVLSGQPPKQEDEVTSRVNQLLEQRLQPFQQFLTQEQQRREMQEQQLTQESRETVESMAEDTTKYPHFEAVREIMADIIEINSKRGVYLPLDQAYNRAIASNPEISQLVNQQRTEEAARRSAAEANAKAQRSLKASRSVSGTPALGGLKVVDVNDRRATIEAAFDELGSR